MAIEVEFYDVTCSIATAYSQPVVAIFANPGGKSSWRIIKTFFKFKKGFPFHVNATHSGVASTRIGPYSFKWNKLSLQKKEKVVFMLTIVAWQFTMLKLLREQPYCKAKGNKNFPPICFFLIRVFHDFKSWWESLLLWNTRHISPLICYEYICILAFIYNDARCNQETIIIYNKKTNT